MVQEFSKGQNPYCILNEEGQLVKEPPRGISQNKLVEILKDMIFFRKFDDKAVNLQRKAEMGTYPELKGHEAIHSGSFLAMKEPDWILPTYREQGIMMKRGINPEEILLYWGGDEKGHENFVKNNIMPTSVPIGSHIPHAAGIGYGLKEKPGVSWCFFGDGATSEGDFHEGVNFASVLDTPTIFVCSNNQYAISVPVENQTNSETIAQKSQAYGMKGYLVDGMDPLAVYDTMTQARRQANQNNESILVELVTYRMGAHTTSDEPREYRSEDEEEKWKKKDPIHRVTEHLKSIDKINENDIEHIEQNKEKKVEEAVNKYKEFKMPSPDKIIDNTYSDVPPHLERQRDKLGDNQ